MTLNAKLCLLPDFVVKNYSMKPVILVYGSVSSHSVPELLKIEMEKELLFTFKS